MKKNILNIIPFLLAAACIISYNIIGSEVLSDGTLVEPFYLIPIACLFFVIGLGGLLGRLLLKLLKSMDAKR